MGCIFELHYHEDLSVLVKVQWQVYLSCGFVCSSVDAIAGVFIMGIGLLFMQLQVYLSWGFVWYSVDAVAGIFIMRTGLF